MTKRSVEAATVRAALRRAANVLRDTAIRWQRDADKIAIWHEAAGHIDEAIKQLTQPTNNPIGARVECCAGHKLIETHTDVQAALIDLEAALTDLGDVADERAVYIVS